MENRSRRAKAAALAIGGASELLTADGMTRYYPFKFKRPAR